MKCRSAHVLEPLGVGELILYTIGVVFVLGVDHAWLIVPAQSTQAGKGVSECE